MMNPACICNQHQLSNSASASKQTASRRLATWAATTVCQRLASFTKIARLSIVLKKYLYHVVPLQSSCPRKLPTIQLLPIITMARWHSTAPRLNSTVWCSNHQTPSPLPDSGLPNQFLSQGYLPLKKCVQICSNMAPLCIFAFISRKDQSTLFRIADGSWRARHFWSWNAPASMSGVMQTGG